MKSSKGKRTGDRDWEILTLTVKTPLDTSDVDLAADLQISVDNLNEDFCDQPAKYAWWATVAAQAKSLADKKALEVEIKEEHVKKTLVGRLDSEVRQQMELDGEKITETKVTNAIYAHEDYISEKSELNTMKEELLELQEQSSLLSIAREAMNQRKDSLISLGAQLRAEGSQTDLNIKKQMVKDVISKSKNK